MWKKRTSVVTLIIRAEDGLRWGEPDNAVGDLLRLPT
jgi:hypothetical protein